MQDKPPQLHVPAAASLTSCMTGGRSMWNCQTYDGLSVCQHWFPLRLNMVICCRHNNLELSAVKTVEVIVDYYQRLQTPSLYIAGAKNQLPHQDCTAKDALQAPGTRAGCSVLSVLPKRWLATICLLYRAIHHQDAEMGQKSLCLKFIPPHDTEQCKKLERQTVTVRITFQFWALI